MHAIFSHVRFLGTRYCLGPIEVHFLTTASPLDLLTSLVVSLEEDNLFSRRILLQRHYHIGCD